MSNNLYKQILQKSSFAFAYHKIILDDAGKPIDYVFLDINEEFEKITGLKSSLIINKKISEVIPEIKNSDYDWISMYGSIALNGRLSKNLLLTIPCKLLTTR